MGEAKRRRLSGMELARPDAPEHVLVLENMKEQLLIVFLKRLGGSASIPVSEIDDTGNDLFAFRVDFDRQTFNFEVRKKS